MKFDDLPVVADTTLFNAARVSRERGDKELHKLETEGQIKPVRTPTRRVLLTPVDARTVYESLCRSPKKRAVQRGRAPA